MRRRRTSRTPTPHPTPVPPPQFIPPPFQGRGEVGGGKSRTSTAALQHHDLPSHPVSVIPAPPPSSPRPRRHSCAPSVIPAQAGTHACADAARPAPQRPIQAQSPSPIHPSPLPGGRLGGGWEAPIVHPRSPTPRIAPPTPFPSSLLPLRHSCAPPSFLRRQEPTHAPTLRTPTAGRRRRGQAAPSGCWGVDGDWQPPRFLLGRNDGGNQDNERECARTSSGARSRHTPYPTSP